MSSTEDPVVLPLPTGQVFVASKNKLQVRGVCPDALCSFSEFLNAPTPDKPLAFDQDSLDQGENASLLFMVNGTKWIYSYDLLQRKWNQAFALPNGLGAIAVKRLGKRTLVLDRTGAALWMHTDGDDNWERISIPVAFEGPLTQIASVKDKLVLASKTELLVTSVQSVLDNNQESGPKVATGNTEWNKEADSAFAK